MYKIVGIKNVNYVSKKTGKQVNGVNLYCVYTDKDVNGQATESFYVSPNCEGLEKVNIGKDIEVLYNKYGNIAQLIVK